MMYKASPTTVHVCEHRGDGGAPITLPSGYQTRRGCGSVMRMGMGLTLIVSNRVLANYKGMRGVRRGVERE